MAMRASLKEFEAKDNTLQSKACSLDCGVHSLEELAFRKVLGSLQAIFFLETKRVKVLQCPDEVGFVRLVHQQPGDSVHNAFLHSFLVDGNARLPGSHCLYGHCA